MPIPERGIVVGFGFLELSHAFARRRCAKIYAGRACTQHARACASPMHRQIKCGPRRVTSETEGPVHVPKRLRRKRHLKLGPLAGPSVIGS